jgi:ATPase family associated with various cellular activities (AAA)
MEPPVTDRFARFDAAYPRTISYVNASDFENFDIALVQDAFAHGFEGDCYVFGIDRFLNTTFVSIAERIVQDLTPILKGRPLSTFFDNHAMCLRFGEKFLLTIEDSHHKGYDIWDIANRNLTVMGFGAPELIIACRDVIFSIFKDGVDKLPTIKWHYSHGGRRNTASTEFQRPKPMHDEFYPWIKGGAASYFDAYMRSDESILVLLGEPGTGKTSFIRNFIWHTKWDAAFTYDEELLKSDELFVEFITKGTDENLLIIEDADVFLTSREHDANKMMARFLNVSDGLFTSPHPKKLVFTANIAHAKDIDNALLREGRCFDCMEFRKLTYQEAVAAADAAGVSPPIERREYTLAQIFADKARVRHVVTGVGFRA